MPAAHARPEERPWRATKRALKREAGARGAHDDSGQTPSPAGAPADAPPQSPLDFAESVFRDPTQPMALRAKMAQVAMPYVHGRWCPVGSDPRDAKPKLSPPFDLPDPYGSLRVEWRDALERAGLAPAGSANEPARAVAPASTSVPQPRFPLPACGEGEERSPNHPAASQSQSVPIPDDPFDPHPGYRWI